MSTDFEEASILLSQGQAEKSELKLRTILISKPKNEECLALLGHSLMIQGKADEAIVVFRKIIKHHPKSANAFVELASAMLTKGNKEDAEKYFQRAVELNPNYSEAWHFLGNLLMQRGARKMAKHCFVQSEKTDYFRKHFAEIQRALEQKEYHHAEKICRGILNQHKNHPRVLHTLALLAQQSEKYEEAVKILQHGLTYSPFHISLWQALVINYSFLGLFEKAIEAAEQLVQIEPDDVRYMLLLAGELANVGNNEASLNVYDKAVELAPNAANVYLQRGHVLKSLGKREQCEFSYRKSFELEYINGAAFWALADLKSYHFNESDKNHMLALIEDKDVPPAQATQAGFALAKSYEDDKDYATAFKYYLDANKRKPHVHFSPAEYQTTCNKMQASYSADTLKTQASKYQSEVTPIFIVGLTRSGSTLIEQILASHSKIEGTMELYSLPRVVRLSGIQCAKKGVNYPEGINKFSPQELTGLGQSYINETAIFRTNKAYFTDKMPPNFHNIGLIHMILPNAIIIDARRHPLSVGLSNFKQHFSRGYDFSYDLNHIGHYYNTYLKLMDYWDTVLPNKVLCVQYEDMVQNTEDQVRRLLTHCGLPFEEQCLKFYENKRAVRTASSEQVRQPINNKGIQQWRHFETYLEPLKESLGEKTLQRFALWS